MLNGLLSTILAAFKLISGYVMALFILIIESAFFAIILYFIYITVRGKFELPVLSYKDVMLILLGVKILKFSSFEMNKSFVDSSHQSSLSDDEKISDS